MRNNEYSTHSFCSPNFFLLDLYIAGLLVHTAGEARKHEQSIHNSRG